MDFNLYIMLCLEKTIKQSKSNLWMKNQNTLLSVCIHQKRLSSLILNLTLYFFIDSFSVIQERSLVAHISVSYMNIRCYFSYLSNSFIHKN